MTSIFGLLIRISIGRTANLALTEVKTAAAHRKGASGHTAPDPGRFPRLMVGHSSKDDLG